MRWKWCNQMHLLLIWWPGPVRCTEDWSLQTVVSIFLSKAASLLCCSPRCQHMFCEIHWCLFRLEWKLSLHYGLIILHCTTWGLSWCCPVNWSLFGHNAGQQHRARSDPPDLASRSEIIKYSVLFSFVLFYECGFLWANSRMRDDMFMLLSF